MSKNTVITIVIEDDKSEPTILTSNITSSAVPAIVRVLNSIVTQLVSASIETKEDGDTNVGEQ